MYEFIFDIPSKRWASKIQDSSILGLLHTLGDLNSMHLGASV